jgi:hypothetical protein
VRTNRDGSGKRKQTSCGNSISSHGAPLPISSLRVAPQRLAAAAMTPEQSYLLQARQMQALSFSVHIALVCFGIALPTLLLFVEWLYLRSGDPLIGRSHVAGRT